MNIRPWYCFTTHQLASSQPHHFAAKVALFPSLGEKLLHQLRAFVG